MIDTVVLFLKGAEYGIPAAEFEVVASDEEALVITATFPGNPVPPTPVVEQPAPIVASEVSVPGVAESDTTDDEPAPDDIDFEELPDLPEEAA
ncbi:MAG TPA: hypothetical protein VF377_08795 [Acidimicrobiia bacterium]